MGRPGERSEYATASTARSHTTPWPHGPNMGMSVAGRSTTGPSTSRSSPIPRTTGSLKKGSAGDRQLAGMLHRDASLGAREIRPPRPSVRAAVSTLVVHVITEPGADSEARKYQEELPSLTWISPPGLLSADSRTSRKSRDGVAVPCNKRGDAWRIAATYARAPNARR